MTGTSPNHYPGVKLADLPKAHWVPLRLAPFILASDRDSSDEDLTAYKPGDVLEAAGVRSMVDWSAGNLGLRVPCERGTQRFVEGGAVIAASGGNGAVGLWGGPLDFLATPDERLADLTTPALARAIRESISEWWNGLTFLAVGQFLNTDPLLEASWAGIVVARIGSPLAGFSHVPPDAFEAIAITDWSKGQAESPCGERLYAMHYAPSQRGAASESSAIKSSVLPNAGSQAEQALELAAAMGIVIPERGAPWTEILARVNQALRQMGRKPLTIEADALRNWHKRKGGRSRT